MNNELALDLGKMIFSMMGNKERQEFYSIMEDLFSEKGYEVEVKPNGKVWSADPNLTTDVCKKILDQALIALGGGTPQ